MSAVCSQGIRKREEALVAVSVQGSSKVSAVCSCKAMLNAHARLSHGEGTWKLPQGEGARLPRSCQRPRLRRKLLGAAARYLLYAPRRLQGAEVGWSRLARRSVEHLRPSYQSKPAGLRRAEAF